jgi:hypothetical protein
MTTSEFYMWRAVFAFAMADRTLTPAEHDLLYKYRSGLDFSPEQLEVLRDDFLYPHDAGDLYKHITEAEHRQRFCGMARALAWCDGDLTRQEEAILKRVSCLGGGEHARMLQSSRTDPSVREYYAQYARNGLMGFWQPEPLLKEMLA